MSKNKTYIIAEAGVNHNGELGLAFELVREAAKAGADAIKFQTFKAEDLTTESAKQADYQIQNIDKEETQFEMLKKLELSYEDHEKLQLFCNDHAIDFLSSPFDHQSAAFLFKELGLKTLKIGSGEITNAPLLHYLAFNNVHIILSTGMSDMDDVGQALGILTMGYLGKTPKSKDDFANAFDPSVLAGKVQLLHCTSDYPAKVKDVNLLAMQSMKEKFGLPVGYSDHTLGHYVAIAAVACGAEIIEKHITLDTTMLGPDHKASIMPDAFKIMVDAIRDIESAKGDGIKKPVSSEISTKAIARKSLHAVEDIGKGSVFTATNIAAKRPASGLCPSYYWDVLGQKADCSYKKDESIERQ